MSRSAATSAVRRQSWCRERKSPAPRHARSATRTFIAAETAGFSTPAGTISAPRRRRSGSRKRRAPISATISNLVLESTWSSAQARAPRTLEKGSTRCSGSRRASIGSPPCAAKCEPLLATPPAIGAAISRIHATIIFACGGSLVTVRLFAGGRSSTNRLLKPRKAAVVESGCRRSEPRK